MAVSAAIHGTLAGQDLRSRATPRAPRHRGFMTYTTYRGVEGVSGERSHGYRRVADHRVARRASRKGTATVEFAVCLPVLVTIVLGSIEATNAIFLKQHLTAAAYEGARKATTPAETSATPPPRASTSSPNSELREERSRHADRRHRDDRRNAGHRHRQRTVEFQLLLHPFIVGKAVSTLCKSGHGSSVGERR